MIVRILDFDWQVITGSPTAPKGNDNENNNNNTNNTNTNKIILPGLPQPPRGGKIQYRDIS